MLGERRRQSIEVLRGAEIVAEIVAQRYVFDPQPHDRHMTIYRELDFAEHLFRAV
jgi:hypothetical protein